MADYDWCLFIVVSITTSLQAKRRIRIQSQEKDDNASPHQSTNILSDIFL